jgi:calcium binding protein
MLPMTRLKENKARERRIEMEVVVDAYNALERAMGWYYYLEERPKFPFKARCRSKREISPLYVGGRSRSRGGSSEKECESEMFVRLR